MTFGMLVKIAKCTQYTMEALVPFTMYVSKASKPHTPVEFCKGARHAVRLGECVATYSGQQWQGFL